jgi:50S ribosomal subunit-associated GTPase HflX
VAVSALRRAGLPDLLGEIERVIRGGMIALELLVPYGREDVLSALREMGGVDRIEYEQAGTHAWGWAPPSAAARFDAYRVSS